MPPRAPSTPPSTALQDAIHEVERARVSTDAEVSCIGKNQELSFALLRLINTAVDSENAYYYGKNNKLIVDKYTKWVADVEKVFADNHSNLPDVVVVREASEGQGQRTFLGVHDSGFHAWANMDAKRKVLDAIYKDVANRSCKPAGDAALSKCIRDKTC